jgi:hypothetical protein
MAASTDALLVGIQAFLRLDAMGPCLGSLSQVAAIRKSYESPGSTAHDVDCKTFAAKIASALGPGNSFQMNRSAYEIFDFAQDAIRLKELSDTSDECAELFRIVSDEADLHRDYALVIKILGALFLLFTPDVPAARAFTEEDLVSAGTSLADAILNRGTCGAIFRVLDYLCGREVPVDSADFAADSARQVETKKLWQRFRKDNCELRGAFNLDNPKSTVGYGRQASHAAVRAQHRPMERQRRTDARKESSAKAQKEVFNARLGGIFEEAASAPGWEFKLETPTNRQFTIIPNIVYVNYQMWRLEEDPVRKAILEKNCHRN